MSRLVTTWFGVFLVDKGEIEDKILFPRDPSEIAERLRAISDDRILDEERRLAEGVGDLRVGDDRLSELGKVARSLKDRDLASRPEVHGFPKSMLQEAMLQLGRSRMKDITEDRYMIQAVRAIDDLNRTANLLSERLHEWYSIHFPELERDVADERYAGAVAKRGNREGVAEELGLSPVSSVGAAMGREDEKAVSSYASALDRVYETRRRMEAYIEERMAIVAPNISVLTGPILGAKLISMAGGLERMAKMPASTIQMLGAEKAFFRHLTEGSDMPKHGVIFQHPLIHSSPHGQRGKIARAFAAKIAIAANADAFGDKMIGEDLKGDLEGRLEEIRRTSRSGSREGGGKGRGKGKGEGGGKGRNREKGQRRKRGPGYDAKR